MARGARWTKAQFQLFDDKRRGDPPLESVTQKQIKDYCKARNIFCLRLNSGKIETRDGYWIELCPKGTPDLLTVYKGYNIWIETKRVGEKPEPHQAEMHEQLRRNGQFVVVAYDLLTVQRFYYEIDLRINRGELPNLLQIV